MERYRSARWLGLAATVLMGLWVGDALVWAVSSWLDGALDGALAVPSTLLRLATMGTFLAWLYRARINAEVLLLSHHDHARIWVFASWFVPVVNLWYPKQVVEDIWRATEPRRQVSDIVLGWWAAYLAMSVLNFLVVIAPPGSLGLIAGLSTVAAVMTGLAAYAAALIIRHITRTQEAASRAPAS